MPARRRTAATSSASTSKGGGGGGDGGGGDGGGSSSNGIASPASPQEGDEAYKLKRKRNNDAVKRTREKSKQTAAHRKRHVQNLREENQKLASKIEAEKNSIKLLKDLLLNGIKEEDHERVIQDILNEATDEEDDDESDNSSK